jgi:hypothetical protein
MRKMISRITIILFFLFSIVAWQSVSFAKNDETEKKPLYIFSNKQRPAPAFDHKLHEEAFDDGGCAACHHVLDEEKGKLVYVEEEADACIECHAAQAEEGLPAIREAYHESCTACHRQMIRSEKKTGPTTCGQCHSK